MKDNIFKFVATSNKFTGTFDYILDGNFKNSEYISSSVSKNDYIQIDMLKPDFVSDIKVKFSSSSDVIRFIIGYLNVDQYGNKEWRYLSSDSTHSVAKIVTRTNSELETAHTNYIEVAIPDGTDNGGTYSISMLRPSLTKETLYCSSIKLIFSSALASVAVSEIQPRNRSIYNEFYGDILYLSTLATIRSSEDPNTYMSLDKEKLTLTENSISKLKLGKLYDGSYGLWAYDNVWLGGDENAPQMKISPYSISLGKTSTQYYNTIINSSNIEIGHIGDGSYSTLINSTSLATGRDPISRRYNTLITTSGIWLGSIGDTSAYNTIISSDSIELGYNQSLDKHSTYIDALGFKTGATSTNYYNAEIGGNGSIKLGHMSNGVYSITIDVSEGSNYISMRNSDSGQQEFFRIGKFSAATSPSYQYTAWAKSLCIDPNGYSEAFMAQASTSSLYAIGRGTGGNAIYATAGAGDNAIRLHCGDDQHGINIQADGTGIGIVVTASNNHGIWSKSNISNKAGVYGYNTGGGVGVYAASTGTISLYSEKSAYIQGDASVIGNFYAYSQMYASNLSSGAGTYTVKWTSGTGQFTKDTSSLRYKHDLEELPFDINLYNNIKTYKFKYNSDNSNDIGFIAEELSTLFPDVVIFDKENRPDAVKYDRMAVYNVMANQHNNSEIISLKERITQLETLVDQLLNK